MTTLTVEVSVTIDGAGAPVLDSVTSVSPSGDGVATLDETTTPPTLSVDDYDCDTVVINLNAPVGDDLEEAQVSSSITPTSAPIQFSWSDPGNPLTLTVTGLTQVDSSLDDDVNLSVDSSSGDPIFIVRRSRPPGDDR
ncbi:MAG: hypothetical protein H6713_32755 [Myxococcales bacterium]|nr:hypothetical protein [Myxococcales bacterium]